MSLKRARAEDPAPVAAAAPEPVVDYEPITFEEAIEAIRPAGTVASAPKGRKELFVGNLDRRVTECVLLHRCCLEYSLY